MQENLGDFFGELSIEAQWVSQNNSPENALVYFDYPQADFLQNAVQVDDVSVLFSELNFVGISQGDVLIIDGQSYRIKTPPDRIDDGRLIRALITKE